MRRLRRVHYVDVHSIYHKSLPCYVGLSKWEHADHTPSYKDAAAKPVRDEQLPKVPMFGQVADREWKQGGQEKSRWMCLQVYLEKFRIGVKGFNTRMANEHRWDECEVDFTKRLIEE
ncbi:unnamed protein product [Choristocarpus tenellus]